MSSTAPRRLRRPTTLAATLALSLAMMLTGCSGDAEEAGSTDPTAGETTSEATPTVTSSDSPAGSATPAGQTIDITVSGDTVVPNGERVEASVGKEIVLRVTADAPGEIHVHSTPEQELTYEAGTSELPLTIDQPGVVDVESHTLDLVIVQLEVR